MCNLELVAEKTDQRPAIGDFLVAGLETGTRFMQCLSQLLVLQLGTSDVGSIPPKPISLHDEFSLHSQSSALYHQHPKPRLGQTFEDAIPTSNRNSVV